MTAPSTNETELKKACTEKLAKTNDPVEKLRLKCLARGIDGIRGLGRYVRVQLL